MHGVLAAFVAAEEIDPATVRPSPLASVVFTLLLVVLILLLWSFVRHLRRAHTNLGPARTAPTGQDRRTAPGESSPRGPADPAQGEGGSR